jgi:hypothetical protein
VVHIKWGEAMLLARTALSVLLVLSAAQPAQAMEAVRPARLLSIGQGYSGSSVNVVANRRHAMFTHARMQFAADWRGRPYIVSYWSDASDSPAQFRVVHHLRETWQTETITRRIQKFQLAGTGTRRPPISRGVLLVEGSNDAPAAHLIYRDDAHGGGALLLSTDRMGSAKWRERELVHGSIGAWEPTIDPMQWQRFQEVHLLIQPVKQLDGNDAEDATTPASNVASLIVNPREIRVADAPH